MKMGWWPCSCCFGCFYRCFQGRKKSRQNAIEPEMLRSPTPSIALSGVSGDVSVQEQLSVFYYGQTENKSPSGRRYSHPNQIRWVEEYDNQRRASTTSTSPALAMMSTSGSTNNLEVIRTGSPPTSPVMMFPVIPPGRLL